MKIILLQDVKSLGRAGDIKDVSEGYARNFLFPKKIAGLATPEAIEIAEAKKAQEAIILETKLNSLRELAGKLKDKKISIKSREKKGKLFGSITVKDINLELKKENLSVPQNCIILKEVIKKTGIYEIEIRLSTEIRTKIKLEIIGE